MRMDTLNIRSDCRILTLCCYRFDNVTYMFAQTFLNALKSLVDNAANLINFKTVYDN